jgi:hypothetical protein
VQNVRHQASLTFFLVHQAVRNRKNQRSRCRFRTLDNNAATFANSIYHTTVPTSNGTVMIGCFFFFFLGGGVAPLASSDDVDDDVDVEKNYGTICTVVLLPRIQQQRFG